MKQRQVLIVGSHPIFCRGIRSILQERSDIKVVGIATNKESIQKMIERLQPDVVVVDHMDARSQESNPVPTILHANPDIRVILLSLGANNMFIYSRKSVDNARPEDLIAAIEDDQNRRSS